MSAYSWALLLRLKCNLSLLKRIMPELSLTLDIIALGRKRASLQHVFLFPQTFLKKKKRKTLDMALSLRGGNGILHDNGIVTRLCPWGLGAPSGGSAAETRQGQRSPPIIHQQPVLFLSLYLSSGGARNVRERKKVLKQAHSVQAWQTWSFSHRRFWLGLYLA